MLSTVLGDLVPWGNGVLKSDIAGEQRYVVGSLLMCASHQSNEGFC